jgi:hypothetical protein
LIVRIAASQLIGRAERRAPAAVAAQLWPHDTQLRSAIAPAMTGVAGWASELVNVMVTDIADRLLAPSVFSQLRGYGLAYTFTGDSVTKVPSVAPVASGSFVGEGQPIRAGALLITLLTLGPKKCGSIVAVTRELLKCSAASVEAGLEAILAEDLSLTVDNILLDAIAADADRPAGLRNGVAGLTPTASGTPAEKMAADVKQLLGAVAPALRPVLIASNVQAAAVSTLLLSMPVIPAPYLAAGTAIMVDAAAFASIVGTIEILASEEAVIHEENTAPLALIGGTAQPPVLGSIAAPSRSLYQTASLALRSILDINWALRRTGSVAWLTGAGW